ncbi:hypothetical protein SAMN05878494_1002 [Bacillus cereus]|nr:hypothetical protein SAMN05878494_1002 [Bacillus cereus]
MQGEIRTEKNVSYVGKLLLPKHHHILIFYGLGNHFRL